MSGREEQIYDEAAALWRELFQEPPPVSADGPEMLDVIMKSIPPERYARLSSPYLRPSLIQGPRMQAPR